MLNFIHRIVAHLIAMCLVANSASGAAFHSVSFPLIAAAQFHLFSEEALAMQASQFPTNPTLTVPTYRAEADALGRSRPENAAPGVVPPYGGSSDLETGPVFRFFYDTNHGDAAQVEAMTRLALTGADVIVLEVPGNIGEIYQMTLHGIYSPEEALKEIDPQGELLYREAVLAQRRVIHDHVEKDLRVVGLEPFTTKTDLLENQIARDRFAAADAFNRGDQSVAVDLWDATLAKRMDLLRMMDEQLARKLEVLRQAYSRETIHVLRGSFHEGPANDLRQRGHRVEETAIHPRLSASLLDVVEDRLYARPDETVTPEVRRIAILEHLNQFAQLSTPRLNALQPAHERRVRDRMLGGLNVAGFLLFALVTNAAFVSAAGTYAIGVRDPLGFLAALFTGMVLLGLMRWLVLDPLENGPGAQHAASFSDGQRAEAAREAGAYWAELKARSHSNALLRRMLARVEGLEQIDDYEALLEGGKNAAGTKIFYTVPSVRAFGWPRLPSFSRSERFERMANWLNKHLSRQLMFYLVARRGLGIHYNWQVHRLGDGLLAQLGDVLVPLPILKEEEDPFWRLYAHYELLKCAWLFPFMVPYMLLETVVCHSEAGFALVAHLMGRPTIDEKNGSLDRKPGELKIIDINDLSRRTNRVLRRLMRVFFFDPASATRPRDSSRAS